MKQYKVIKELKGDLLLGDTKYKPEQTIIDRGNNPKLTRAIARCLAMKKSPIKEVTLAENKLLEQQSGGK